jgi:hypothetical protein
MKKRAFGFDSVAGIFLICIFAVTILLTLRSGAGVYKKISEILEEQYTSRTVLGYVTAKIHACDESGGVELGDIDGVPAICLKETYDEESYVTYIYAYDGYVMELFCSEGEKLSADAGIEILPVEELEFSKNENLVKIDCTTSQGTRTQYVALASEGRLA